MTSCKIIDHHEGNSEKIQKVQEKYLAASISFKPNSKMGAINQLMYQLVLTPQQFRYFKMLAAADMWNEDVEKDVLYYIFGRSVVFPNTRSPDDHWNNSFNGIRVIDECIKAGQKYYTEVVEMYADKFKSIKIFTVRTETGETYSVVPFPYLIDKAHQSIMCVKGRDILPVNTVLVFWDPDDEKQSGASLRFVHESEGNLIPLAKMWFGNGHKMACGCKKDAVVKYFS